MRNFHIISLPRSGTAWLSVFLSHGNSFCFHDLLADTKPEGLMSWYKRRSEGVVGSVETAGYREDPSRHLPANTQYFYIYRSWKEVRDSWAGLSSEGPDVLDEHRKMMDMALHLRAARLDYSQFNSLSYLDWIWGLIVGSGFDAERAARLKEMNITRDLSELVTRATMAGRL